MVKKIDESGLFLCDLQAKTFEQSLKETAGSGIFIRRYMKSNAVKQLDSGEALIRIVTPSDLICDLNHQYGETEYGKDKYSANELYWIGYIYRYFAYTYGYDSPQVYKIVKPGELRSLYPAYHTMDCPAAIERILEAKGRSPEQELQRQYAIFKRYRKEFLAELKNKKEQAAGIGKEETK